MGPSNSASPTASQTKTAFIVKFLAPKPGRQAAGKGATSLQKFEAAIERMLTPEAVEAGGLAWAARRAPAPSLFFPLIIQFLMAQFRRESVILFGPRSPCSTNWRRSIFSVAAPFGTPHERRNPRKCPF